MLEGPSGVPGQAGSFVVVDGKTTRLEAVHFDKLTDGHVLPFYTYHRLLGG